MFRIVLVCGICTLVGCTTTSTSEAPNAACDKVASFARGVAIARAAGMSSADLNKYITVPTVAPFPVQSVKMDVYKNLPLTPVETYNKYYMRCDTLGVENFNKRIAYEN